MPGSARRPIETVEFEPLEAASVVGRMDELAAAGDGWVNLMPGVPQEVADEAPRGFFSALFGSAQPPVSMATWMPPGSSRRASDEETVGFMHPRGRGAIDQLASGGVVLPAGWRVGQDHARRGLIVHPAPGTSHADVLSWTLRAGAALTAVPLTGRWQARVYLPLSKKTRSELTSE